MHPIFGLIGPSGSGKTMLIEEMLIRWPEKLGTVKSLATRERRGAEDDRYYDFVSRAEMNQRIQEGRLIQSVEFAGNLYGNDRNTVNALLEKKFGIMAIVEPSIKKFRDAGYKMILIKIQPVNHQEREGRAQADEERAKTHLAFDHEIVNSFKSDGKEKAIEDLATILKKYL